MLEFANQRNLGAFLPAARQAKTALSAIIKQDGVKRRPV
jgi:hypothetical protein